MHIKSGRISIMGQAVHQWILIATQVGVSKPRLCAELLLEWVLVGIEVNKESLIKLNHVFEKRNYDAQI